VPFYLFDRYANEHIKNKIEPVTITGLPVPQKKRGRPRKIQNSEACDHILMFSEYVHNYYDK
jgi:hypothetical protein